MSVKVFQTNSNGKIEFTRAELEKLLNDTYKEGHRDGENKANNSYWTWTSPYVGGGLTNVTPLNTAGTAGTITCRTTDVINAPSTEGITITCNNATVDASEVAKLVSPTAIGSTKADVEATPTKIETKVSTTPKITANVSVNGAKSQVYDLSSLAREIDQILLGIPTLTGSCGTFAKPKNEHNANLAKELRNV